MAPHRHGRRQLQQRLSSSDPLTLALDFLHTPFYGDFDHLFQATQDTMDRLARASISSPRYMVSENKEEGLIELSMELPGVSANDLNVEIEDNRILRIQGSRTIAQGMTSEFDRSFQLDKEINPSSIHVTLSSGILKVTGAKKEREIKQLPIECPGEAKQTLSLNDSKSENEDKSENSAESTKVEETVDGMTITTEDDA